MSERRQVLSGIPASPGVAVGRVTLFDVTHVYVPRRYVAQDSLRAEEQRLRAAIEASRAELEGVRARMVHAEHRLLLDAQLLMHRDELLIDAAVELLRARSINAEWALAQTIGRLSEQMRAASEPYLRERSVDIEHVGQRMLRALTGERPELPQVHADTVIVGLDLGPADAAQLLRSAACGIAIDLGSASSHTAILARALEIPAVVGARGIKDLAADDDVIIVDGFRGEIILCPLPDELEQARARADRFRAFARSLRADRTKVVHTQDGCTVALDANVELPAEAALAIQEGADGIGLYRTEFLFLDRTTLPSEEEQIRIYADVVRVMSPRPVVFRTFDIGGDKLHGQAVPESHNPALGVRGLRLGLAKPELLKTQLRAMLVASALGEVRVMFPMVSSLDEVLRAKQLFAEARQEVLARGQPVGDVKLGVMIETPAAVLIAGALAREADFFSVGTNDLVQYTVAVDRGDPRVAPMASPLHPAVLRLLAMTRLEAASANVELSMCGGMAADPLALPIVLGLGFARLSVDLAYMPFVRAALSCISLSRAVETTHAALACATTREVKELVFSRFSGALGELWREQGLDPLSFAAEERLTGLVLKPPAQAK